MQIVPQLRRLCNNNIIKLLLQFINQFHQHILLFVCYRQACAYLHIRPSRQ
nr:MAG TPA: hypothetical protein [Caudoviricetes sp.]